MSRRICGIAVQGHVSIWYAIQLLLLVVDFVVDLRERLRAV